MKKNEFLALIDEFSSIIECHELTYHSVTDVEVLFKAKLKFVNTSKLAISDHQFEYDRRKYSYQWMGADNSLIIRWDNVKHYPNLENFPHHKHVGSTGNVFTSEEMDLKKILSLIKEEIAKS